MTFNKYQRERIIQALIDYYDNQWDGTDAQFANMFDINKSAWSQLKQGYKAGVIRDEKLATIGRLLDVHWKDNAPWNIVKTEVHEYITQQLLYCQENAVSRIYCDLADVGKTTAAKYYKLRNKNVFYIDCSKVKAKSAFVRALAKSVGANDAGSIAKVAADTVYLLQAMDNPLVILDEFGDLHYEAVLEVKGYWNALENYCAWYIMGADGLAKKMDNNIRNKTVGYAELFRRFGSEYMGVFRKLNPVDHKVRYANMMKQIAQANVPQTIDHAEFVKSRKVSSLTRLKEDVKKLTKNPGLFDEFKKVTA